MSVTIGIIAPDGAMRAAMKTYLRTRGHGVDFYDMSAKIDNIDVVILSTALADVSAYATCQELREKHPQLPIVIMSNELTLGEDVKAEYAGASAVFKLPFEPRILDDFLNKVEQNG